MRNLATFEPGDDIFQMFVEQVVKGTACGIDSCRTEHEHIKLIWHTRAPTLTQRKLCDLKTGAILTLCNIHHRYIWVGLFWFWFWFWFRFRFRFRARRRWLSVCWFRLRRGWWRRWYITPAVDSK
jgi:hypothetical protein